MEYTTVVIGSTFRIDHKHILEWNKEYLMEFCDCYAKLYFGCVVRLYDDDKLLYQVKYSLTNDAYDRTTIE